MLNLRHLNMAENAQNDLDAQRFSQFSIDFRAPSNILGDIGEHLDHSQSERLHEDDLNDSTVTSEERPRGGVDLESASPVAGPSRIHGNGEERRSPGCATHSAEPFEIHDDQVVDASRPLEETDIAAPRSAELTAQVRNSLFCRDLASSTKGSYFCRCRRSGLGSMLDVNVHTGSLFAIDSLPCATPFSAEQFCVHLPGVCIRQDLPTTALFIPLTRRAAASLQHFHLHLAALVSRISPFYPLISFSIIHPASHASRYDLPL